IGLHFDEIAESYIPLDPDGTPGTPNTASYNQLTRTSDGIGSLAGDSGATPPALVFVEDSVALKGSDITSYTWGATNPDVFHASLQDFTITLTPGIAEPGLWGRLAVGKHLKTATIQLSKVSALGKPHVYTTYTLTNVTISSFTTSEQGGAVPQDTIGLHFDQIAESYIPLDPDGTPGSPNTASYNQLTRTSDGIGSLGGPISTTSLTASSSSTVYGAPVTSRACVTPREGGTPPGAVHFFGGATDLSAPFPLIPVNGGQVAIFITAILGAGTHTIRAQYADPTNVYSDSSGATSLVVGKA